MKNTKTNKTGVVIFLILVAVAIWALNSVKTGNNGITFFAGGNDHTITYPTEIACTSHTFCQQEMIKQGASVDVNTQCNAGKCVVIQTDIIPQAKEGSQ